MDQGFLVAIASAVAAVFGAAAVAMKISFSKRNEAQGNGSVTSVTGKGNITAGRDYIVGPRQSEEPGQQNGTN
ncbi:hypothetical protein [Streptomyces sp. NPDC088794]|uniref:hypothetical protein n=1 Tax=Streptomyces sp. NPDC088794 TaxID=3365902 RepID=UPI0038077D9A